MLRSLALALSLCIPLAASGQGWPAKPIRLLLGYTSGGAADAMARPLIAKMEPLLGSR